MRKLPASEVSLLIHTAGFVSAVWLLVPMRTGVHSSELGDAALAGWIGLPFLLAALATFVLRRSQGGVWALTTISLVNWMIVAGSVYYEHVVRRPDSQAGFLFVALPILELLGTGVGIALAAVIAGTVRRSVDTGT